MNVPQYLQFKNSQVPKGYIPINEPIVHQEQINALYNALMQYHNSECVNQTNKQVQNAKNILTSTSASVQKYVRKLLTGVIYNYMMDILPVNGEYVYDAGVCKNACGYGRNRIVAILANTLIDTNPQIEEIELNVDLSLFALWIAFKSNTLKEKNGTGIIYNFNPAVC